jgi:hypothetical protein
VGDPNLYSGIEAFMVNVKKKGIAMAGKAYRYDTCTALEAARFMQELEPERSFCDKNLEATRTLQSDGTLSNSWIQ